MLANRVHTRQRSRAGRVETGRLKQSITLRSRFDEDTGRSRLRSGRGVDGARSAVAYLC